MATDEGPQPARIAQSCAVLTIRGPLARGDLPGLYARACALLGGEELERLECVVAGVAADAVALEALARLALAARRRGCGVRVRGCSLELGALLECAGLARVLGASG
jgi:ABC-type transporter Mla MlaB component